MPREEFGDVSPASITEWIREHVGVFIGLDRLEDMMTVMANRAYLAGYEDGQDRITGGFRAPEVE